MESLAKYILCSTASKQDVIVTLATPPPRQNVAKTSHYMPSSASNALLPSRAIGDDRPFHTYRIQDCRVTSLGKYPLLRHRIACTPDFNGRTKHSDTGPWNVEYCPLELGTCGSAALKVDAWERWKLQPGLASYTITP